MGFGKPSGAPSVQFPEQSPPKDLMGFGKPSGAPSVQFPEQSTPKDLMSFGKPSGAQGFSFPNRGSRHFHLVHYFQAQPEKIAFPL